MENTRTINGGLNNITTTEGCFTVSTNQVPDIRKEVSAVEWLESKLKETYQKEGHLPLGYILYLSEQAKQIEKEQIEMAFAKSYLIGLAEVNYDDVNRQAEQYYNETYGGQGSPDTTFSQTK